MNELQQRIFKTFLVLAIWSALHSILKTLLQWDMNWNVYYHFSAVPDLLLTRRLCNADPTLAIHINTAAAALIVGSSISLWLGAAFRASILGTVLGLTHFLLLDAAFFGPLLLWLICALFASAHYFKNGRVSIGVLPFFLAPLLTHHSPTQWILAIAALTFFLQFFIHRPSTPHP